MLMDTVILSYNGEKKTLRKWANHLNLSESTVLKRYKKGLTTEEILSKERLPSSLSKKINYKGKKYTFKELEEILGVSAEALYTRYKRYGSIELEDNNQKIKYKGQLLTIREISKKTGIKAGTIRDRIRKGVKGKALFEKPAERKKKNSSPSILVKYKGKKYSFKELAHITGVKEGTLRARYKKGLRGNRLTKGERKPQAKIDNIYKQIYKEYQKGETFVSLSKKYKKSDSTIRRNFLKLGYKLRSSEENKEISGNKAREAVIKNQTVRIKKKIKNEGYSLLDVYKGQDKRDTLGNYLSRRQYKIKHSCGKVFYDDLQNMPRCPKCFGLKVSIEEDYFAKYIEEKVSIKRNQKIFTNKNGHRVLEADIVIPSKKIIFEYNGLWWHHSKKKIHKIKTDQALEKGYNLFHVWSHWDKEKVKAFIDQKLNLTKKVFARKTEFKQISNKMGKEFFDNNHLDNGVMASHSFGLFFKGELVMALSYRHHKEGLEIARFASKKGISVVGGFSKIFKNSIKEIPKTKKIITFNNRDISPEYKESVYFKNEFDFVGDSGPILFYTDGVNVFSREKFQKHKLAKWDNYSEKKTAHEILEEKKIYPVWNSGNFKFEFKVGNGAE